MKNSEEKVLKIIEPKDFDNGVKKIVVKTIPAEIVSYDSRGKEKVEKRMNFIAISYLTAG